MLEQALAIWEKKSLADHEGIAAATRHNLAGVLVEEGDYEAARPLEEYALAIAVRVYGAKHRYTAASLNNLARLCLRQGDYEQAASLLAEALSILEANLGPNNAETIVIRRNLQALRSLIAKQREASATAQENTDEPNIKNLA